MHGIEKAEMHLIGLELESKTSNLNGKANIDCGKLWHRFETEEILSKIEDRLTEEIIAVYYDYEGDYTEPYSYFIGCEVPYGTEVPHGMSQMTIQKGQYRKFVAKGKMPDCISDLWQLIWATKLERAYKNDFEIYGAKSKNWENAEVEVFVGVK